MIALYVMLAILSLEPRSAPTVFACEHYESQSDTDGVGSFVDLRAVRDADNRRTLEFERGRTLQVTWSWIKKEKGLGRLEWRDGDVPKVGVVLLVTGSEDLEMPSFWLSEGEPPAADGPGYMCNGRLEASQ